MFADFGDVDGIRGWWNTLRPNGIENVRTSLLRKRGHPERSLSRQRSSTGSRRKPWSRKRSRWEPNLSGQH